MAKRRTAGKGRTFFPVEIDIPTLSGGVGRSTPSKRLPSEAENLDNIIVSLEHSAEKRRGLSLVDWETVGTPGRLSDITDTIGGAASSTKDLWFHWFRVSVSALYIIAIDFTASEDNDLWWVFKINDNGKLEQQEITQPDASLREYITYNPGGAYSAQEVLRAVAVGSSILILNNNVKAGFTSDETSEGKLYGMDGLISPDAADEDTTGPGVEYLTSITVDPEGDAEVWTEWSQYIAGDKSIDTEDRLSDDDTANDYPDNYEYLRKGLWEVSKDISGIVGPDDSGASQRRPSHGIIASAINQQPDTGMPRANFSTTGFNGGTVNKKATCTCKFLNNFEAVSPSDNPEVWVPNLHRDAFRVLWFDDQQVTSDTDGEQYAYVRVWFDDGITSDKLYIYKGHPDGGIIWDPDTDVMSVDQNIYIVIGTSEVQSVDNLVQQVVAGINKGFDQGVTHCRAEADATLTGFEIEVQYYQDQWEYSVDEDTENRIYSDFIKVSDYYYPDPDKKYLGQAVSKLSDIRFPPSLNDLVAFNGGPTVENMLASLYEETGDDAGKGKLYYLSQSYLGLSEGHYRLTSAVDLPYLTKIRTPNLMSIIDKRRMPKQITISDTEAWVIRDIDWDVRRSGNIKTNPGPSIFHDGDGVAIQRAISAVSFYRGRLFLAAEDILVSSVINDWDNFWVENPESIAVSDPVDLRVSSNDYTPITYLQPYRSFLFLATDGSTQYELVGSENQVSPLTAEIAPTSFFSMARNVPPVLLNNSLFFLDKKKLYIYFGEQANSSQNSMEISVNVPEYLPTNYRTVTVSPVTGSFFMVDADNPNHIYCYTNRIGGDQILQNSYYRFILSDGVSVKSLEAVDDLLYVIWEDTVSDSSSSWTSVNAGYIDLKNEELNEPRMDNLLLVGPSDITALATSGGNTTFNVKCGATDINTLILWDPSGSPTANVTGELFAASVLVSDDPTDAGNGIVTVTVTGADLTAELLTKSCYIGVTYRSTIELSPIYYRDAEQNAENGALNLRVGEIRYRNSGDFFVSVSRKGRAASIDTFNIDIAGMRANSLTYKPYRDQGIFKVPVLGFSHDITISIASDSVYPLAISDIEFSAKFKQKLSNLGSM